MMTTALIIPAGAICVIVGIIIGLTAPVHTKVDCPTVVEAREPVHVMTNEEIITETKKCHDAGLGAERWTWNQPYGNGPSNIYCYPIEK
jgi:hypothetical protein